APGGWKLLTSSSVGDPRFATFEFCTGQCWYDMGIYSPAGRPDTVFVIGSYNYDEAYGLSNARGVLRSTTAGEPDPANNLVSFTRLLSAVPTGIFSLNSGLHTLQFQSLSINPQNPLGELQGGTQDNGTFQFEGSVDTWLESIGGDGGLSGFDASNPTNRFHTF